MTAARNREVDGIGFEWRTSKAALEFIRSVQFEELTFTAQHGHCMATKQYSTDPKLGNWVSKQRINYEWSQEGTPSPRTAECIRELESIGFKLEPHLNSNSSEILFLGANNQCCEYKVYNKSVMRVYIVRAVISKLIAALSWPALLLKGNAFISFFGINAS